MPCLAGDSQTQWSDRELRIPAGNAVSHPTFTPTPPPSIKTASGMSPPAAVACKRGTSSFSSFIKKRNFFMPLKLGLGLWFDLVKSMWQRQHWFCSKPGSQEHFQLPLCSLGTSTISTRASPASAWGEGPIVLDDQLNADAWAGLAQVSQIHNIPSSEVQPMFPTCGTQISENGGCVKCFGSFIVQHKLNRAWSLWWRLRRKLIIKENLLCYFFSRKKKTLHKLKKLLFLAFSLVNAKWSSRGGTRPGEWNALYKIADEKARVRTGALWAQKWYMSKHHPCCHTAWTPLPSEAAFHVSLCLSQGWRKEVAGTGKLGTIAQPWDSLLIRRQTWPLYISFITGWTWEKREAAA